MLQRIIDYTVSIAAGGCAGLAIGALFQDPAGGALVGAVAGVFVGAGVRAWRTRDKPDSYENRSLTD